MSYPDNANSHLALPVYSIGFLSSEQLQPSIHKSKSSLHFKMAESVKSPVTICMRNFDMQQQEQTAASSAQSGSHVCIILCARCASMTYNGRNNQPAVQLSQLLNHSAGLHEVRPGVDRQAVQMV